MTQTSSDIVNEAMRQWADSRVNTPLHKIIHNAVTAARLDERRRIAESFWDETGHYDHYQLILNAPSEQSGERDYWLCRECGQKVKPIDVTNDERHVDCGGECY